MNYERVLHQVILSDNVSEIDLSELSLKNDNGYTVAHTAVSLGLAIEPSNPALELTGGKDNVSVRELLHRFQPQTILTHK